MVDLGAELAGDAEPGVEDVEEHPVVLLLHARDHVQHIIIIIINVRQLVPESKMMPSPEVEVMNLFSVCIWDGCIHVMLQSSESESSVSVLLMAYAYAYECMYV